jgi:hypothetical protein
MPAGADVPIERRRRGATAVCDLGNSDFGISPESLGHDPFPLQ